MKRILIYAVPLLLLAAVGLFAATAVLNIPTGTEGLFLVDKVGSHLRFFDAAGLKELANIPVSPNPHDFVFSADHRYAYVPLYGDGVYGRNPNPGHELLIVDLKERKLAGRVDIAPYRAPHGIQIGKSGLIYLACDLDRKILVVDPKTRTIKDVLDAEGTGHWIGLLPDESKIYVTNKKDKLFISVIDLKQRKITARIDAPNGTEGIAVTPDGKTVFVMDSAAPYMSVIDSKTDKVTDRIQLKGYASGYKVYVSPDGKRVLTMSGPDELGIAFDVNNLRGEQKTFPTGKFPMGYAFSADGKHVLSANHGDGTVSVVDLATLKVVRKFDAGKGIETLGYY